MVDFAGISGGLELLQDQIDGDTVQTLGKAGDFAGWPAAMAAMQAKVAAETPVSEFARVDYAGLPGAITNLEQGITSTLAIHGTPVTDATVDEAYAGFAVSGTGGMEPYVFSVHSGALPTGITLNASTGVVAGTPTVEDDFVDIILRVTDAFGDVNDLAPFDIDVTSGSVPAWVEALRAPSGDLPLIVTDFENNRGWNAGAECTLSSLLVENLAWGQFNPTSIVAGKGLTAFQSDQIGSPVLTADTSGLWVTGYTYMVETSVPADATDCGGSGTLTAFDDPDFNFEQDHVFHRRFGPEADAFDSLSLYPPDADIDCVNHCSTAVGLSRYAATFLPGGAGAVSSDGGAVATGSGDPINPIYTPTIGLNMGCSDADPWYVTVWAIYAPQPDADLHLLSA